MNYSKQVNQTPWVSFDEWMRNFQGGTSILSLVFLGYRNASGKKFHEGFFKEGPRMVYRTELLLVEMLSPHFKVQHDASVPRLT